MFIVTGGAGYAIPRALNTAPRPKDLVAQAVLATSHLSRPKHSVHFPNPGEQRARQPSFATVEPSNSVPRTPGHRITPPQSSCQPDAGAQIVQSAGTPHLTRKYLDQRRRGGPR